MDLREFVHSPGVTCSPDTPVSEVAQLMEKDNVGSVIVIDADGKLSGIVTDRDIALRGMAAERAPTTPIAEIMTKKVVWLQEDANVLEATRQIAAAGCRRLPVIGAEGALEGMLSLDDLLQLFARQIDNLASAVASETAKPKST